MRKPYSPFFLFLAIMFSTIITGCSVLSSYTYYELESDPFESGIQSVHPTAGENHYLPIKDNMVILYEDSLSHKQVAFYCFNSTTNLFFCGPTYLPFFPLFGLPWNIYTAEPGTVSLVINNPGNEIVTINPDDIKMIVPDGKVYQPAEIKGSQSILFHMNVEQNWFNSFTIDLGEVTINDEPPIHPVIQFSKEKILAYTSVPLME